MKTGDKIELSGIEYTVVCSDSSNGRCWLSNRSGSCSNDEVFNKYGIFKEDLQLKVLGYQNTGVFPICKNLKDLEKFVGAIREEIVKGSQEEGLLTLQDRDNFLYKGKECMILEGKVVEVKHRVFISGKVTGNSILDTINKFEGAEEEIVRLFGDNVEIINPLYIEDMHFGIEHGKAMDLCYEELGTCSHIYLLDDWEDSKGAKLERSYAIERGMTVIYG